MKLLEKIPLENAEFDQFKKDAKENGRSWRQHAAWIIRTYLNSFEKTE